MIKVASEEDLDVVHSMTIKFIEKTPYSIFYDRDKIRDVVKNILLGDNGIVLLDVENRGMLIGLKVQFAYGITNQALELAWWVEEEHRNTKIGIELLGAFEYWAEKNGCKFITMSSLDDGVGKYYEKQGYELTERTYMKELY